MNIPVEDRSTTYISLDPGVFVKAGVIKYDFEWLTLYQYWTEGLQYDIDIA